MHFTSAAIVAALAGIAKAQSNMVDVYAVTVGSSNGTLKFSPEKLNAPAGSMVQFQFLSGAHTVTQSSFDNPCNPIAAGEREPINSGSVPVDASVNMGQYPLFTIQIIDDSPLWLYCATGAHCANGMSMVINENTAANNTRTLENYRLAAAAASPGAGGAGGDNSTGGNGGNTGLPELPGGDNAGANPGGENTGAGNGADDLFGDNGGNNGADAESAGQDGNGVEAAGSYLVIPSTLLLAAAGIAMLF